MANVPPEVPEEVIRTTMARYREVKDVHAETWSSIYRCNVTNALSTAVMTLAKHIPSSNSIPGHRVVVSYEGQPMMCYRCHETGRFHQACPMRRRAGEIGHTAVVTSWEDIAAQGAGGTRRGKQAVKEEEQRTIHTVREEREPEREGEIHADKERSR